MKSMPKGNTQLKIVFLCLTFAFFLASTLSQTHAVEIDNPLGEGATFSKIINSVVNFANSILAPLSTLMVLIAGFLYMTGGGNPEKIKTAHKVLIWALVGIGIVLLAKSAEVIIRGVLGVSK